MKGQVLEPKDCPSLLPGMTEGSESITWEVTNPISWERFRQRPIEVSPGEFEHSQIANLHDRGWMVLVSCGIHLRDWPERLREWGTRSKQVSKALVVVLRHSAFVKGLPYNPYLAWDVDRVVEVLNHQFRYRDPIVVDEILNLCLLYTSPSPRDRG